MINTKSLDQYRPNVGVTLFRRDGCVWYGHRAQRFAVSQAGEFDAYQWQMPQGGIDKGEEIATAAARELWEETGVRRARLLTLTPGWLAYDFPKGYRKRNWKGQRQKWAAMLFEGDDTEINLTAGGHQEFDDWRWGELEEAPSLIVPFKRHIYEELMAAFAPLRDYLRSTK